MNAQLGLDLGTQLAHQGQAAVLAAAGDWADRAVIALRHYLSTLSDDAIFAIEDFRRWPDVHRYIDAPAHHNAWGALTNIAIRLEIIEPIGQTRPAQSARTHAHPVRLHRKGVKA